ncbi:MAG: bifunctional 5,10-methylenetetrahydrofolate dehydrogenase/5,10-methenyltetrahydrofolate cyclohydrolase [Actinobacteria bacterium]|nr:bifunctional 5,10-methylenetetrahydrofolate dehydrogenase/5,10-methenyltetrahydrofolate cyclohydrolase [Actinomycetota bacterium]
MSARIIDGKALAGQVRAELAERVRGLVERGIQPRLAAVLVGDDEPSRIYVGAKQKACADVGIDSERIDLSGSASQAEVLEVVRSLNEDPRTHGFIVQLPLPDRVSELAVQLAIAPEKDVDGLTPVSVGLVARGDPAGFQPATPYGIVEMLVRSGIATEGAHVVIVGRGQLVGMPLAVMLAQKSPRANATVTLCHTRTRDLARHTRGADILVAAVGRPGTITADMVRPGATVIDVAVNRTDAGLVGDVDFDAVREVAGAITPVPGGVGPMTVAMLLANTVTAAERRAGDAGRG